MSNIIHVFNGKKKKKKLPEIVLFVINIVFLRKTTIVRANYLDA